MNWQQPMGAFAGYAASDAQGRRFRVFVSAVGWAPKPAVGEDVLRAHALRSDPWIGVVWETEWQRRRVLVTDWPAGQPLTRWCGESGMGDDAKLEASVALCRRTAELAQAGVGELLLHPERVFVTQTGRVSIDGLGFEPWLAGYWEASLRAVDREPADYAEEHGVPSERRFLRGTATLIFELFTGGLPRGSFFALPSQRSVYEPRLDELLMAAVGVAHSDRVHDLDDLATQLGRVVPGDGRVYVAPAAVDDWPTSAAAPRKEHFLNGLFSWMPGWLVLFAIAVGALSASAIGWFEWKKAEAERAWLSGIDTSLGILDEAAERFGRGERDEALQKVGLVAKSAPSAPAIMEKMAEVMEEAEEYDEYLRLGRDYLNREILDVASDGGSDGAIIGMWDRFESFSVRIQNYKDANSLADRAHRMGRSLEEYAALERAALALPDDDEAAKRLRAHPLSNHLFTRDVLASMGTGLKWKMVTTPEGVFVDLSGNRSLRDVRALRFCKLYGLDLSQTGVRSLEAMRTMGLQELAITDTPVRSLAALGNGLERIWVLGSRISEGELLNGAVAPVYDLVRLKSVELMRLGSPKVGRDWRNSMGMHLVPIPTGAWIGSQEVQVRQFREFLRETGRRSEHKGVPASTRDRPTGRLPLAWVTREEAESFCDWLTERERRRGWITSAQRYRLPGDREWGAAAGFDEPVGQGPMVRARINNPRELAAVGAIQLLAIEFSGPREPVGGFAADVGPEVHSEASRLGESGRFQSLRAVDDLAVGVSEWLSTPDAGRYVVRGGSWRGWKEGSFENALLTRRELSADWRADDIGFRVLLEGAPAFEVGDLEALVIAGEWEELGKVLQRLRRDGRTPLERWAAGSMHASLSGGAGSSRARGGERYSRVLWPLSFSAAEAFCAKVGGELAVARDPEELKWMRKRFCRPDSFTSLWIGEGAAALPWPAEIARTRPGERHAFVIRWRGDGGVADARAQEPE